MVISLSRASFNVILAAYASYILVVAFHWSCSEVFESSFNGHSMYAFSSAEEIASLSRKSRLERSAPRRLVGTSDETHRSLPAVTGSTLSREISALAKRVRPEMR